MSVQELASRFRTLQFSVIALAVLIAAFIAYSFGAATPAAIFAAVAMTALGICIGWAARPQTAAQVTYRAGDNNVELSRRLASAIVEAFDLPALILDRSMRVITFNRAVQEFFPQIAENKSLQHFSRHPELFSAVRDAATQLVPRVVTMTGRIPFGRRLLATVSPLKQPDHVELQTSHELNAMILIQFRDLTEQDRLAQMRSDFIANASHELRTPLASLKGFIETLRGPARDDAAARQKFLGIMESQAARMARILDDLLSLSRIEMRTHLVPAGSVDLTELLTVVVQGIDPLAQVANITLSLDTGNALQRVRGDGDELEQVFQNLIHNAIKYGREGGKVNIQVSRRPTDRGGSERIAVSVTDDGPGIASEHLPRLTERFYRVDSAASRDRGGTGLGLAIVKHILVRHRGDLEIKSVLDEGSTFTVLLDALPESTPA